ncbi:MAG TPA: cytosine permease, partial [Solirubrobacteraceae bacterium]|nr:cytosine permease [Solirubrobacteraceae bacterium]
GTWSTLVLNIPDFTRFSRSQKDQTIGQVVGLPITALLFSFMSILITSRWAPSPTTWRCSLTPQWPQPARQRPPVRNSNPTT